MLTEKQLADIQKYLKQDFKPANDNGEFMIGVWAESEEEAMQKIIDLSAPVTPSESSASPA